MDLLRGDSALLDAAKKGNLSRVQKLLSKENINCRDSQVKPPVNCLLVYLNSHLIPPRMRCEKEPPFTKIDLLI